MQAMVARLCATRLGRTMSEVVPTASGEIHRADPAERRRTLILLLPVVVCGALLILGVQHELDAIRAQVANGSADLGASRFLWLARGSFAMLAAVGLITGGLIAKSALAVIREQRYPHQAARLLRDREVIRGQAAVTYGRLGILLAAGFALVGCLGAWAGWRLLALFE
jgi:hypothetical protein